ncbi:serine/threonine-protein kinase [Legionella wadsworthii]|uniref:Serine/threonine-protein kinase n=1 Tax=Legionella wadsworthii TaxID=28088 RepID=A0A378LRU9_9GAMM|nr:hypothetical protein [Legionella wadsworthii]STY29503.1 serine/threonine-protein kinase [Legionella wadsworthii]
MYQINGEIYYDCCLEAKLVLIDAISQAALEESIKIKLIEEIQILIENHGDKSELMSFIELNQLARIKSILPVIENLARSPLNVLPTKYMNTHPLVGASESFLPPNLLLNPTSKMVETRGKVTDSIVKTLEYFLANDFTASGQNLEQHFQKFAINMIFESSNTYPGTFPLDKVNKGLSIINQIILPIDSLNETQLKHVIQMSIDLLKDPIALHYQIMAIHAQFGYSLIKFIPIFKQDTLVTQNDNPVYKKIVEEYTRKYPTVGVTTFEDFLSLLNGWDENAKKARRFICDEMMYQSMLYTVESHRGRGNPDQFVLTNKLGVMRNSDSSYQNQLPRLEAQLPWVDWTKCEFREDSKIVNSMTATETPFISSFSGTTSLLLNIMISSNALKTLEEQQIYLVNIMSYVSGVGFHSMHEILGPAAWCLNLIPRDLYPIEVPNTKLEYRAPLYHNYFQIIGRIDPEFMQVRNESNAAFLKWYREVYFPNLIMTSYPKLFKGILEKGIENQEDSLISFLNVFFKIPMEKNLYKKLLRVFADVYYEHKSEIDKILNDKILSDDNPIREMYSILQMAAIFDKVNSEYRNNLSFDRRGRYIMISSEELSDEFTEIGPPLAEKTATLTEALRKVGLSEKSINTIISQIQQQKQITSFKIKDESILQELIFISQNIEKHSGTKFTFFKEEKTPEGFEKTQEQYGPK